MREIWAIGAIVANGDCTIWAIGAITIDANGSSCAKGTIVNYAIGANGDYRKAFYRLQAVLKMKNAFQNTCSSPLPKIVYLISA